MRSLFGTVLALALSTTAAWAQATVHQHYAKDARTEQPAADGRMAPRLQSLGKHKFPVTTKSAEAQKYVDQGMNLTYGFNHAEAGRAFAEAARLDPRCAMAFWGQALVLGPNINAPMEPWSARRSRSSPGRRPASAATSKRWRNVTTASTSTATCATRPTPGPCASTRAASPATWTRR